MKYKFEWWHLLIAVGVILVLRGVVQPQAAFFDSLSTARSVCDSRGGGTIYECIGTCPNDKPYCANFNSDDVQDPCDKYGDYQVYEDCGDAPFVRTCEDSDGGLIYRTKGTVTSQLGDQDPQTHTDVCQDANVLLEYYCNDDDYLWDNIVTCTNGCENGACVDDSTQDECNEDIEYAFVNNNAEWDKDPTGGGQIAYLVKKAFASGESDFKLYHIQDRKSCCEPTQLSFTSLDSRTYEYDCGTQSALSLPKKEFVPISWILPLIPSLFPGTEKCSTTYQLNGYTYRCEGGSGGGGLGDGFCGLFSPLEGALPDAYKDMSCLLGIMLVFMALLIVARMFGS